MLLSKGYALAILASISSIVHFDCVQGKNPSALKREYGRNSQVRTGKKSGLRFVPNSSHRALTSPSKGKGSGDTEAVSAPSKGKGSGDIIPVQELGSEFTNECYVHLLDSTGAVGPQDASAPSKGSYSGKGKSSSLRASERRLSSSKGSPKGSSKGSYKTEEYLDKDVAFSIDLYSQCVKDIVDRLIRESDMLQIAKEQAPEREILIQLLVSLQGDSVAMMESLKTKHHCELHGVNCNCDNHIIKLKINGLKGVLPNILSGLEFLKVLDLTGTYLSFDTNLFTKFPKSIEKLDLSEISYLPTEEDLVALENLTSLTDFIYNKNKVTHELAYLPFSKSVKKVILRGNSMTCLPVFGENTKLEILSLEDNDIYAINIACSTFDEALKLPQLNIANNKNVIKESLSSICGCGIEVDHGKFQCSEDGVVENIQENPEEAPATPSAPTAPSKGKGSADAIPSAPTAPSKGKGSAEAIPSAPTAPSKGKGSAEAIPSIPTAPSKGKGSADAIPSAPTAPSKGKVSAEAIPSIPTAPSKGKGSADAIPSAPTAPSKGKGSADAIPSIPTAPSKGKGSADAIPFIPTAPEPVPEPVPPGPSLTVPVPTPTGPADPSPTPPGPSPTVPVPTPTGPADPIPPPPNPCENVICDGDNESCNGSNGLCECDSGFERNEGNCEPISDSDSPFVPIVDGFCLQRGNPKNGPDEVGTVVFEVIKVGNSYIWQMKIVEFENNVKNILRDVQENVKVYVGTTIPGSNAGSYNVKFTDRLKYVEGGDLDSVVEGEFACGQELYYALHLDENQGETIWAMPCYGSSAASASTFTLHGQGWGGYFLYQTPACD